MSEQSTLSVLRGITERTQNATERPLLAIGWKASTVCGVLRCPCGHEAHHDSEFDTLAAIECAGCGQLYSVPHSLQLEPLTAEESTVLRAKPDWIVKWSDGQERPRA